MTNHFLCSRVVWLCPVAYAENFHGGIHSVAYGGHLYLVCAVCDVTIRRHIQVSKPTFWRSLLTQYACSSTRTSLILCAKYKLSALQVRISEENALNATTQQFITAKISGCALKQGSKTRSSLRQSNLQLQNEAALILSNTSSGLEHKVWGWSGWRTPPFARLNFAKLHKNWECA